MRNKTSSQKYEIISKTRKIVLEYNNACQSSILCIDI